MSTLANSFENSHFHFFTGNAQLTISAVVDAAKELPCCSRTITETNQCHVENIEASSTSFTPPAPVDDAAAAVTAVVSKSNGHKSISTTENTPNNDISESISRVSSNNSIHNPNRKSSINLEPGFIETIMDDYIRKTN